MRLKNILLGLALSLGLNASAETIDWHAWAVHSGNTVDNAGSVTFTAGLDNSYSWSTGQHGNKAFYSTDFFNGQTVSVLDTLTYNGAVNGPYVNIYVTDGLGRHAILLPTGGLQNNQDFSEVPYSVFESTDQGWLADNSVQSFAAISGLLIGNGPYVGTITPDGGWASWAAPADGLSLVWGNRSASDYLQPTTISDLRVNGLADSSVPDGGSTLALLGIGVIGLARFGKRKIA